MEDGPGCDAWRRPYPPAVSLDDGAANRQAKTRTALLRGKERVEDVLAVIGVYPGTVVLDRHQDLIAKACSADAQHARPRRSLLHGFCRIRDQIQKHLLQLNFVGDAERKPRVERGFDRNAAAAQIAS